MWESSQGFEVLQPVSWACMMVKLASSWVTLRHGEKECKERMVSWVILAAETRRESSQGSIHSHWLPKERILQLRESCHYPLLGTKHWHSQE